MKKILLVLVLSLFVLAIGIEVTASFQPIFLDTFKIGAVKQAEKIFGSETPIPREPVSVWMLKDQFQFAEVVFSQFISRMVVYVQQVENEENFFSIYKNENGNWVELALPGREFDAQFCVNGELLDMQEQPEIECERVRGEYDQGWYPIHVQTTPALCGKTPYDAIYLGLAEPGEYKIVYSYWLNSECSGTPSQIEREFLVI